MNKQRYFKLLTKGGYEDAEIGSIYPLKSVEVNCRGEENIWRLSVDFYDAPLNFLEGEVEEVFDYIPNAMDIIDEGVAKYAESSERVFASGSKRDNADDKPLPFELHPYMLLRYGYHMKTGQLNYGKGNWQLTQPDVDVWESGGRHFAQALLCFQDPELAKELELDQEDHLSALLFFINMLMQNEAKRGIKPNHYFKGKTK